MTPTRVEFMSSVDKAGYRITPPKRPPRQPGQSEADWVLDSRRGDWEEARIVGLRGARKRLRVADYPMLFSKFAQVRTPEELLNFVAEFGLLTARNEIPQLLDAAKEMRAALKSRRFPTWQTADLQARVLNDRAKGTVSIKYSPTRLIDALWLQLAQALSGGAQIRECKHCGEWFPVGGKDGRRIVSQFCKDDHRIEYNSLERTRRKRSR
jgi:hypothetical protein